MIRKDVIVSILATFCLTATLFVVLPTKSNPSAGEYDSWADINDDGKINMYDIGYTAQRFETFGDSTRNVNVTNWQQIGPQSYKMVTVENVNVSWQPGQSGGGCEVDCEGYSRIYLSVYVKNSSFNIPGQNDTFQLCYIIWYDETRQYILGEQAFSTYDNQYMADGPSPYNFTVRSAPDGKTYPGPASREDGWWVNSLEIIVRAPVVNLGFSPYHIVSQPHSGWITFDVRCCIRNE